MNHGIKASMLLAGVVQLLFSPAAAQDVDWFAQAENLSGCSAAVGHTGWIEIAAVHHLWFKNEGENTDPQKKEFIVTRRMDCSTIPFWEALRQQIDINELVLEAADPVSPFRVRQILRFENVRVQSIETADDFPDDPPLERIRFSYDRIEFESKCYTPEGDECGSYQYTYDFSQVP